MPGASIEYVYAPAGTDDESQAQETFAPVPVPDATV
jgi:hypothetical protein